MDVLLTYIRSCILGIQSIFFAGQLHDHSAQWRSILNVNDTNDKVQVENWIKNRVDDGKFFQHFKGNFKG